MSQEQYLHQTCYKCHYGKYQLPESGQEWHVVCDSCGSIHFTYQPLPHQYAFHADPHKFKMFAGGYGSGKTTTGAAETIRHILTTPRGTTLIGAATLPQLEQTAQKEFFEMFPKELIAHYNKQKNYLVTTNGHTVIFRPLDDEEKARSLNLTFFWIEEASVVNYTYFEQLKTRLRNKATKHHQGILTTNPDMGYVKSEFLLKSDKIYNSPVEYLQDPETINENYSTHIAPTHLNTHLPENYYEDTARGQPDWWVNRYLLGSFENREGLVYPDAQDHIIKREHEFPIPKHWERVFGADFGWRDPTVGIVGAIDPQTGILYFYKEHYESEKPVNYHAEKFNKMLEDIPLGKLQFMVGDPKGKAKSERDSISLFDHYAEYGIFFDPAMNKIEDGIMKVQTWFSLGKIKIFESCQNLLWELTEAYRFPERKLDDNKNAGDKPLDKDNHAADVIRYIVNELPDDPNELINPSINPYEIHVGLIKKDNIPYELQDNRSSYDRIEEWQYYY